ncbi:MAG: hypothetical protein HRT90_03555 [Candidatus Margulisbacteria bacterium]|nr:hypothetical protein [Candidatus Margulisiibacteriota bacterium]
MSDIMENECSDDPMGIGCQKPWIQVPLLAARVLGMGTLALYSVWALPKLWAGCSVLQKAEAGALLTISSFLNGTTPFTAQLALMGIPLIIVCILSAIYLILVSHKWVKKIIREWKWVWKQLSSPSWFDKLLGVFGFVLTLFETVLFV